MYETSMLRQAIGDLQVGIVFFPASYWGFAIYAAFEFWHAIGDLRQAIGDLQVGIVFFPASYWCFAIYATFEFWQAIGDLQCTKLLCCGKLLGICKWALFSFQQAIGVSRFTKLLSFGKLLGICKGSVLLKRVLSGRLWRIRNLCKSNAVLHRFTFQQAIGDSTIDENSLLWASYWGFAS